jgi:hypothetical protein
MADVVVLKSGSNRCVVAQWDAREEPWVFDLETLDSPDWSEAALSERLQELVDYNLERDATHRARAISPPPPPPSPTAALGDKEDDADPAVSIEPAEHAGKAETANLNAP